MPARPLRILAAVLAFGLIAVPASAGGSGDDPASRHARWAQRDGRLSTRDPQLLARTFLRRMTAAGAESRPSAQQAAAAALLDFAGIDMLDEYYYDEVVLVNGGDLDGDGNDDALEYEVYVDWDSGDYNLSVTGIRGTDGEQLWGLGGSSSLAAAVPAGDLDGDAGVDLLAVSIARFGGAVRRWDIRFNAIDGATGAELWGTTYQNVWSEHEVRVNDISAYSVVDTNFAMPMGAMPDANGDGRKDVLVAVYNAAVSNPGPQVIQSTFQVLSGADGSVLSTLRQPPGPTFQWAFPVGDVSGDAKGDMVLAAESSGSLAMTLDAYPGTGGDRLWRASFDGWVESIDPLEATGDAREDLLVHWFHPETEYAASLVSGANGSRVWTVPLSYFGWLVPAGDADGDGGQDFLSREHDWHYDEETGEESETGTVRMLDGTTAEELWGRTVHADWIGLGVIGDIDGDGVGDASVTEYVIDDDWDIVGGTRDAISGDDGGTIWTRDVEPDRYYYALDDDVDGDGGDDFVEMSFDDDYDSYRPLGGMDLEPMWDELARVDGWLYYLYTARLTGGQGVDFLESIDGYTGAARSGDDGELLWRLESDWESED